MWCCAANVLYLFLVAPLACCGVRQVVTFLSFRDKKMSEAQSTLPQFTHRVKVQTKMNQKVQCKGGGLKLIFVDQIWVQRFRLNRLI